METIVANCLVAVITSIVFIWLMIRRWQQKKPDMILTVSHLVVTASYGVLAGLITFAVLQVMIMLLR